MKDGMIRRSLKSIALIAYLGQLRLHRAWLHMRGERPYRLGGSCGGCAKCCEEPAILLSFVMYRVALLRRGFVLWQRLVNGFVLTGTNAERRLLFFRCTHLDPSTRRCDSYDSRPGMCRDYPRVLLYQPNPELFETCGYRAIDSNASGLLRVLQEQPMSDDQREKLEKGLRLK